MPQINFEAILPNETTQPRNSIRIKGQLKENAKLFSINFVADPSTDKDSSPQNIPYHFKWLIENGSIIENSKSDGEWSADEVETSKPLSGFLTMEQMHNGEYIDQSTTNLSSNSESEVALEFGFGDGYIGVYWIHGSVMVSTYENIDLSNVKAIQVWDDLIVTELTFLYPI